MAPLLLPFDAGLTRAYCIDGRRKDCLASVRLYVRHEMFECALIALSRAYLRCTTHVPVLRLKFEGQDYHGII